MNYFLTAALDTSALLSEAGMTVLIGFCVVFAALLLLTIIFWVFGVVAQGKEDNTSIATSQIVTPAVQTSAKAPLVEDGIPDEVVAVIAAAVSAMSEGGTQYAVRRIRSAHPNIRPVWAAAGIADNTQPF